MLFVHEEDRAPCFVVPCNPTVLDADSSIMYSIQRLLLAAFAEDMAYTASRISKAGCSLAMVVFDLLLVDVSVSCRLVEGPGSPWQVMFTSSLVRIMPGADTRVRLSSVAFPVRNTVAQGPEIA